MKIDVFSFAVNDKFPIDIAHRQYKRFVKDEFEYILFNDAPDLKTERNINTITSFNNIKTVRVPQNIHKIHNPSACYGTTLNWAVHDYAVNNNCELVVLVHTDVFPICDVSISEIIGNKIAASVTEFRLLNGKGINYFYPAFTIVNMNLLKNPKDLDFGLDTGLDTGGKTRYFIEKNSDSVKFVANHQISYFVATLDKENPDAKHFQADLDICREHGLSAGWIAEGFYHYMAGSQWNAENPTFAAGHEKRMKLFLSRFY